MDVTDKQGVLHVIGMDVLQILAVCLVFKWFERASPLKTRHKLEFDIPLPASTVTNQQLADKAKVRETIFTLRKEGKSYREIAKVVGLHFTRVRQILRQSKYKALKMKGCLQKYL